MRTLVLAALAALALTTSAAAQGTRPAAPAGGRGEGWRVQLSPYAWLPAAGGSVRPAARLPTFDTSLSMGDVLRDLDGAFFLHGTARRDRFLLLGDFSLAALSKGERFSFPELPLSIGIKGKVTQTSLTLALGYSVVEEPDVTLDLLAGARAWWIRASVRGDARLAPFFEGSAAGSASLSWVDPILGARLRWQLSPRWSLIGYADIGGFGAGSRFTWQILGTANYQVSDQVFLSAGYRHMSFDYRSGGRVLDLDMSGPLLGMTVRF